MVQVDKIIYEAIKADENLMEVIGGRVQSTCFDVSPTEADNTPLPNVIITDEGFQNQTSTKDNVWEAEEDSVQVGVKISAESPEDVQNLVRKIRKAVSNHIYMMYENGDDIPELESLTATILDWDWIKPCYYQYLVYNCNIKIEEYEQD